MIEQELAGLGGVGVEEFEVQRVVCRVGHAGHQLRDDHGRIEQADQ